MHTQKSSKKNPTVTGLDLQLLMIASILFDICFKRFEQIFNAKLSVAGIDFSLSNIPKNIEKAIALTAGGLTLFNLPKSKAGELYVRYKPDSAGTVYKIEGDFFSGYPKLPDKLLETFNVTTDVNEIPSHFAQFSQCNPNTEPLTFSGDDTKPWLPEFVNQVSKFLSDECQQYTDNQSENSKIFGIMAASIVGGIVVGVALCVLGCWYCRSRSHVSQNAAQPANHLPAGGCSLNGDIESGAREAEPLLKDDKDDNDKHYGNNGKEKEKPKTYEERLAAKGFDSKKVGSLSESAYESFICPISKEVMQDPVVASDRKSYDRKHIEAYFETRKRAGLPLISPVTQETLTKQLIPNDTLKSLIEEFVCRFEKLDENSSQDLEDGSEQGKGKEKTEPSAASQKEIQKETEEPVAEKDPAPPKILGI